MIGDEAQALSEPACLGHTSLCLSFSTAPSTTTYIHTQLVSLLFLEIGP